VLAAALAVSVAAAPSAGAIDFSDSQATCKPTNGATARVGDFVDCDVLVDVAGGNGLAVTADTTVPAHVTFDPSLEENMQLTQPDPGHPGNLHADELQLGFMSPGFRKLVRARFQVAAGAQPYDPIQMSWLLHDPGSPDATITSNVVPVTPPPADLTPSTMTCDDVNGGTLLPGEQVQCQVQLVDKAQHEDATNVNAQTVLPLGKTTATAPQNESFRTDDNNLFWLPFFFPDGVKSGPPMAPLMKFGFTVADTTPGGTTLTPLATILYKNALSQISGAQSVFASLVTAPGPAILTDSSLTCTDTDAAPLLPGDTVLCSLTVTDAAGRENVENLTGVAPPPAATHAADGKVDGQGGIPLWADKAGKVVAGAFTTTTYKLRVDDGTPAGTKIVATAHVDGTSVPTQTPVAHDVTAKPLTVAKRDVPAAVAPPATAASAPAATPAATPARNPRLCYSRRKITINVAPPAKTRWKSVTLKFAKKTVKAKRLKQNRFGTFRAIVTFYGLPKGPLTVSIVAKTTNGKTVRRSRHYRLCTKKGAPK
jgi:hypothetical protein